MPNQNVLVQLVTRIPYALRHRAKVHCVRKDTTLTQFVIDALNERLAAERTTENPRRSSAR
jgi:hypothetical protein